MYNTNMKLSNVNQSDSNIFSDLKLCRYELNFLRNIIYIGHSPSKDEKGEGGLLMTSLVLVKACLK